MNYGARSTLCSYTLHAVSKWGWYTTQIVVAHDTPSPMVSNERPSSILENSWWIRGNCTPNWEYSCYPTHSWAIVTQSQFRSLLDPLLHLIAVNTCTRNAISLSQNLHLLNFTFNWRCLICSATIKCFSSMNSLFIMLIRYAVALSIQRTQQRTRIVHDESRSVFWNIFRSDLFLTVHWSEVNLTEIPSLLQLTMQVINSWWRVLVLVGHHG